MQGHVKNLQVFWKAGLQLHWLALDWDYIRLFRMKVASLFHLFFLEAYSKANVVRVMVV